MTGSKEGTNWFDNIETDTFSMATAKGGTSGTLYKDLKSNSDKATSKFESDLSTHKSNIGLFKDATTEADFKSLQSSIAGLIDTNISKDMVDFALDEPDAAKKVKDRLGNLDKIFSEYATEEFINSGGIDRYKSWIAENGIAANSHKDFVGYYKTGLSYVPYDGFRAILHKGERVQTAAEVNLEKANYAADGSSKMATALQDSLVRQTDVIIGLLQDILGAIGGKSPNASEYMEELNAYSYTVGLPSNS